MADKLQPLRCPNCNHLQFTYRVYYGDVVFRIKCEKCNEFITERVVIATTDRMADAPQQSN